MADLPDYSQALPEALSCCNPLEAEHVALPKAAARVLREAVTADRDQPPFDRSAMDGFALRADAWAAEKDFRVVGSIPAGGTLPDGLELDPQADVVRIATGAAVPRDTTGFDAVVQIEKAQVTEGDSPTVRFTVEGVKPGMNIHQRGADATAGQEIIPAGTMLRPHHLGIAAAVGAGQVSVTRKPRVVILSSGDELRPIDTPLAELEPQQIRNSNGPMLVALLYAMGCEVVRQEHVVDEAQAVTEACTQAVADADLVITSGGVSVGQRDLFPATWPTLGYETVLHGVKMQPGKPVFVAKPQGDRSAKPQAACVIGLPGNPVSVLATAHLFAWPMVRRMLGLDPVLPWRRVWLSTPTKPNARREAFRAARFVGETREQVEVLPWQGSGDLSHTATAEGWVRLPASNTELHAGTPLMFLPLLGGYSDTAAH
ncbi:molybdopterin molybdotransferase MoeA [Algisphaera agarilytica]|uniref:Molybdopterin molybdenumtransferase n=1 Tax=Algisphaera agarilytica TaxID=1385975 RepID=A0A7X0H8F4_9BACT|nr:molybdopterin molybdotransferase MoeA [Algisphaera agarilytica]MBB6429730.1 molybdopterin molybdotransferase [Algisphaera agarilytica]